MTNVVDLGAARADRDAASGDYISGMAVCLSCRHRWAAVAPRSKDTQGAAYLWMECPKCTLMFGRFEQPIKRDADHWECRCGNDLFRVIPDGVYCPTCGLMQEFPK